MDLSKIFLKDACPTTIGGQAVMEGVMMRGTDRMATSIRLPDGRIHIKTQALPAQSGAMKIPVVRGVFAFFASLVVGMKTLMYSADVLEYYMGEEEEEKGAFTKWLEKHFGERAAWNIAIYAAVIFAILFSVGIFILLPTVVVNLLAKKVTSKILLNLCEGLLRLGIFIGYIALVGRMKDIRTTFEYHGAEHKSIHCFENGLELTPENAQTFYTLHPRCGTSFLMFVMIISLILFSLLGWPNIWVRLLSRILLIPVVAGLSYELLKWAGRSDNAVVKVLSMPGLLLQKLTTREPSNEQLEIAIASMKAVLVDKDAPYIEGICDKDANLLEEKHINSEPKSDKIEAGKTLEIEKSKDKAAAGGAGGIEANAATGEMDVDATPEEVDADAAEEEIEMSERGIFKKARDMGTGFLDKMLGRDQLFDEYDEEFDEAYDDVDAELTEEEEEAPRLKPWQKLMRRQEEDVEYVEREPKDRDDHGFMNIFSKQREDVGTAPSGRTKNAAGIPLWDEEEEVKKAKG